jgi:hypothetical protein
MASAVRQITSVGGDIRKIARLLQKKAPPGHMLAYINQEEADLLKARGGSGEPHEDTGIPSFDEEGIGDAYQYTQEDYSNPPPQFSPTPAPDTSPEAQMGYTRSQASSDIAPAGATAVGEGYAGPITATSTESPYAFQTPRQLGSFPGGSAPPTPASLTQTPRGDKSLLGTAAEKTGLSEDTLKRLGISGLQGLIGAYQANKAQQAGQAGKEELSALAAPYKQQAQDLIGKAQRGELTPVGQQQLQAVQAQAAQGAERRGGVGAQQSMAQVEAFRQQLLQSQYDYGLKLSGIADNIITGAIKTGLQADQYVSNLTNSYFGNMARIMAGVPNQPTPGAP